MYPKKELPFFILFTAGLCSFTALLALLTHQYPEPMGIVAKAVSSTFIYVNEFVVQTLFNFFFYLKIGSWMAFITFQLCMG